MLNKKAQKNKSLLNHHFIFIEVPNEVVAPLVLQWNESDWWPKDCMSQFDKITDGEIREGTQYTQKIKTLFGPKMSVEITKFVPNKIMERTFLSGMLKGYEVIKVEERANGTRIDYELNYQVTGLANQIFWPLLFLKKHDDNIKLILNALRNYCQVQYQQQFEQGKEAT